MNMKDIICKWLMLCCSLGFESGIGYSLMPTSHDDVLEESELGTLLLRNALILKYLAHGKFHWKSNH